MAEQEVVVSSSQKRRSENIVADKTIKKTKMSDIKQELNANQASDSYEEENFSENSEEDGYSFGAEEEDEVNDCEEDESSRSPRQEENDGSRSISAEEKQDKDQEDYAGSSEDESSGSSDCEKGGVRFAEGSNAFRAAFSRIMEKKVADDALGPVLSAHKKLIAKRFDEEAEFKVKSEAKKEKRLLREKGHVKPESSFDAKEKSLIRLATKGVVKLFNAVSKAQSVQAGFDVSKSKDAKAARKESKAAFLSELRRENQSISFKPGQFSSVRAHSSSSMEAKNGQVANESGWAALRDDFMLTNSKLKDWDKMKDTASVDEMPVGHIDTDVSSSDED